MATTMADRLTTLASQRTACSRVRLGNLLAGAVPCLTTREAIAAAVEDYAANVGAQVRGETWRKAKASHDRIIERRESGRP